MKITLVYAGNIHEDRYVNPHNPRCGIGWTIKQGERPVLAWIPHELPDRFIRQLVASNIPLAEFPQNEREN